MFQSLTRRHGVRTLGIVLVVVAFVLGFAAAPASAESDKRVVKVMTYNMDAGTDFMFFFAQPDDPAAAFAATYAELLASGFEARAARLADTIADEMPYLVSLQEATVWDFVTDSGSRVSLLADQLALLTVELEKRGLPYQVVAVQPLTNLALPLGEASTFTFSIRTSSSRERILKQAELALSNVQAGVYEADVVVLGMFTQINGWMSVDAKVRGKSARFFATHLESPLSADDPTQMLQGQELIGLMDQSPIPVILAGDLNSDLSGLPSAIDKTPTAYWMVGAGYADCWTAFHPAHDGLTWPMFWEDVYIGLPPGPVERIDLILAKGLDVLGAEVVGHTEPFPSDHAGVVATLLLAK